MCSGRSLRCSLGIWLVAVCGAAGGGAHGSDEDLSAVPGDRLVQRLASTETRARAFHELCRRDNPKTEADFADFLERHYDPERIICPQGDGLPPLHVVVYGFAARSGYVGQLAYPCANLEILFPPAEGTCRMPNRRRLGLRIFASDGTMLWPFGKRGTLEPWGLVADINGDGLVERVDHETHPIGAKAGGADVLAVRVVRESAECLLAILFNWGEDEWDYRVTDEDRDGIYDIRLGTRNAEGITSRVTFRWDGVKRQFAATGDTGDGHYRILPVAGIAEEIARLKADGFSMPPDPEFDAKAANDVKWRFESVARRPASPPPEPRAPSPPYERGSIAGLSDDAIIEHMGPGRRSKPGGSVNRPRYVLPDGFWDLAPKHAALRYADANRSDAHRGRIDLAVDDRLGIVPPDCGWLIYTDMPDGSYVASAGHYFLRFDPRGSYFVSSVVRGGGVVFDHVVKNFPSYRFRFCPLAYSEARNLAQAIWWLKCVRSRSIEPKSLEIGRRNFSRSWGSRTFSSADGRGGVELWSATGEEAMRLFGRVRSGRVAEEWLDDFDSEVCLALVNRLMVEAFPERLGEAGQSFAQGKAHAVLGPQPAGAQYPHEEVAQLVPIVRRLFGLFEKGPGFVSAGIVGQAVAAAGDFACGELAPDLESIRDALAAAPMPIGGDVAALRDGVALALTQIEAAGDAEALGRWACSEEKGARWALQRLREIDPVRYARALEWWLEHSDPKWARQLFEELRGIDEARAREQVLAPTRRDDLVVSGFALLAKQEDVPAMEERVPEMLRAISHPDPDMREVVRGIDLLVPPDAPLRFRDPEIDRSLSRLLVLDPKQPRYAKERCGASAAAALARRGRAECFDAIAECYSASRDASVRPTFAGALALLARMDPGRFGPRLADTLRPQLSETNRNPHGAIWAAWAADLRLLRPEIVSIATSGPDDEENVQEGGFSTAPMAAARSHLAREVAMLWDAEDALSRAKLLVVFGQRNSVWSVRWPERRAMFKQAYRDAAGRLDPGERKELARFVDRVVPEDGSGPCPSCSLVHGEEKSYGAYVRRWIAP